MKFTVNSGGKNKKNVCLSTIKNERYNKSNMSDYKSCLTLLKT